MHFKCFLIFVGLWVAITAIGCAADPFWLCPQSPCPLSTPPSSAQARPGEPGAGQMPGAAQPPDQAAQDAFAQAPAAGTGAESYGNPNIMGDYLRATTLHCFSFTMRGNGFGGGGQNGGGGNGGITSISGVIGNGGGLVTPRPQLPSNPSTLVCTQFAGPIDGGPLKIGENENARPQDRIYLDYNGYYHIFSGLNKPASPTFGGVTPFALIRPNADPAGMTSVSAASNVGYQYQTLGLEKTFFDGNASLAARIPLFQLNGDGFNGIDRLGDITFVSKLLLLSDGPNGDALCAGLGFTVPTGMLPTDLRGHKIHSYVFQPYYGLLTNLSDNWYFEGFHSLAVPTTREDATIMFIDGSFGYWLYRGRDYGPITGIVPTTEFHINWPWTNRGEHNTSHAINVPSSIDLTEGIHILFGAATLTVGISFPVTGPRPYDVEGIAQLNWRY